MRIKNYDKHSNPWLFLFEIGPWPFQHSFNPCLLVITFMHLYGKRWSLLFIYIFESFEGLLFILQRTICFIKKYFDVPFVDHWYEPTGDSIVGDIAIGTVSIFNGFLLIKLYENIIPILYEKKSFREKIFRIFIVLTMMVSDILAMDTFGPWGLLSFFLISTIILYMQLFWDLITYDEYFKSNSKHKTDVVYLWIHIYIYYFFGMIIIMLSIVKNIPTYFMVIPLSLIFMLYLLLRILIFKK